jgi:predicted nuclease of restriction endonuclease-like (RecB) superfamily
MATRKRTSVKSSAEAASISRSRATTTRALPDTEYSPLLHEVATLIDSARRRAVRAVNTTMTELYWQIGHTIVEREQGGARRAGYGEALRERLAGDLTTRFGRGFSRQNLDQMCRFYLGWEKRQTLSGISGGSRIRQTLSGKSAHELKAQTVSAESVWGPTSRQSPPPLPLPWSHYVLLLSVESPEARAFYETEALRGGWTVRQLKRQVTTLFYERTLLSKNKAAMLRRSHQPEPEDAVTPEEEIRNPLMLEFLDLKDEYSETQLEEALIQRLESFLLELGNDFAFIGRQRRLRVGDAWYRVDLLFFHRALRCLVIIDLKVGEFTHADAGQMHLYLNYAREHWVRPDENPPVGLILCTKKDSAVAKYALEGLSSKVLATEYRLKLPTEQALAAELEATRRALEARLLPAGTCPPDVEQVPGLFSRPRAKKPAKKGKR